MRSTALLRWGYAALLAIGLTALNLSARPLDEAHPDSVITVGYLAIASSLMTIPDVRIDQGRLTLHGLVASGAAILLNPLDATIVGLVMVVNPTHGPWPRLMNPLINATGVCVSSIVTSALAGPQAPNLLVRLIVLLVMAVASPLLTATAISIRDLQSPSAVLRRNVTPAFGVAFVYFALGGLLISYVLDGSPLGYLLATVVCLMSLALTDSIAGRRIRNVLESELTDADRHLFHSRAVDGVVHNLRNHVGTAHAYLKEIDPRRLDEADRDSLTTATAATDDAVSVLHILAQGATPSVKFAPKPIDLNELAAHAAGIARPRARAKEIQLAVRESAEEVMVKADPLLIREVMTNLVNNAIDAAPKGGRVEIRTGHRNNGWPFVSVGDNGPGVSDENRHHLFEPHYTTKEGGTGLGLFMSYGVVREHQGNLSYEGTGRGAIFTVTLPPFTG
jgi:signal transduction histidine kinase